MWALLALYQALRIAITDAVATVPGTDPDRASFQVAVQTARALVTGARGVLGGAEDLAGDIGRAVLASLHGPRRPWPEPRTRIAGPSGGRGARVAWGPRRALGAYGGIECRRPAPSLPLRTRSLLMVWDSAGAGDLNGSLLLARISDQTRDMHRAG
jgi:hypothetical protein